MTIPFADLQPSPEFPPHLLSVAKLDGGMLHVEVGEDGEIYIILGHPRVEDVRACVAAISAREGHGWDDEDLPTVDDLLYTCAVFRETGDSWEIAWGREHGTDGAFPVVVWDAS